MAAPIITGLVVTVCLGSMIGWLAADAGVGVLVCLVVRLLVFRPDRSRTLGRTMRSYLACLGRRPAWVSLGQ
jgi:predicted MFS family arabinose efflux permease